MLQTSSNDGNLSVIAMVDLNRKFSNNKKIIQISFQT
jgi:hypothetical protein